MIIPLTSQCATKISKEFQDGTIRKEYIARCNGEFSVFVVNFIILLDATYLSNSSGKVVCEEPLLTVDRQMGLNIVHPDGKVSSITNGFLQF